MSDDLEPECDEQERHLNSFVFPRRLLKKFILLYKELPALWDRTNPAYKLKPKRHEAITTLTELVQQHDPTATRVHVLRKIESLRACVRREHKRVRDSRRTANSPEELYKPHLWYYDLFSFVFTDDGCYNTNFDYGNYVKPKEQDATVVMESDEDEEAEDDDNSQFEHESVDNYQTDYSIATSMLEVSGSTPKQFSNYEEEGSKAKRLCTEVEDEYDAIGINVAAKLRNLPPNMRILAEKLINDVMFQAQLNGLNASTVISTPDPFKQDPM